MNSIKCPQCGLTNWETAEWCKRCKFILKSKIGETPNVSPESQANFASGQASNAPPNAYSQSNRNNQTKYPTAEQPTAPYSGAKGFVVKSIVRCNRNWLIVCILVLLGMAGVFYLNSNYFANVILGAYPIERDELLSNKNLPSSFRYYVKVTADEAMDTGGTYVEVSKRNVETLKSRYFALAIGDKLLLAEVDPDGSVADGAQDVSLTGEITNLSSQEDEKILQPILRKQPQLRADFLPFILKAKSGYYYSALFWGLIGSVILLIIGLCIFYTLGRLVNPEKSSVMKYLAIHGSPMTVANSIDAEMAGNHEKMGPVHISPNWIVLSSAFAIEVQNLEDIVWGYEKVTKHSVNFIPTGKTYQVILHNMQGKQMSLTGRFMNDERAFKLLVKIQERVPWFISGYSDELSGLWSKDKNSFIESVMARKKSFIEQTNQNPL